MPRKCGACGEMGHNKRTCSYHAEPKENSAYIETDGGEYFFKVGQALSIKYPWRSDWISTKINDIDQETGEVTLVCRQRKCFYGFNLKTIDKYGILFR